MDALNNDADQCQPDAHRLATYLRGVLNVDAASRASMAAHASSSRSDCGTVTSGAAPPLACGTSSLRHDHRGCFEALALPRSRLRWVKAAVP